MEGPQTLKERLERQRLLEQEVVADLPKDGELLNDESKTTTNANLADIEEFLPLSSKNQTKIDKTVYFGTQKPSPKTLDNSNLFQSIDLHQDLITKEIAFAPSILAIAEVEPKPGLVYKKMLPLRQS